MVAYAFKFALLADMNQGCIPSLFSVTSIYISIIFYFKFNEVISVSKIIGILMMVPCVVLLSMDPKEVDEAEAAESDEESLTKQQMKLYGILAVMFGIFAPFFWIIKIYFIRLTIEEKSFDLYDLAIDSQLFQNVFALMLYLAYLA